jgi:hypothetical protein
MAVTNRELAERLERVEKEVAELKPALGLTGAKQWYREIIGCFVDDEASTEIARLGRLIRQQKPLN